MKMNCLCGMVNHSRMFSFISSWNNCQKFSPLRISNVLQAVSEPAQNLSSDFVERSYTVVIIATPRHHKVERMRGQEMRAMWACLTISTFLRKGCTFDLMKVVTWHSLEILSGVQVLAWNVILQTSYEVAVWI